MTMQHIFNPLIKLAAGYIVITKGGKVIDCTTFTQSHIAFMTTDKEKTTITKVKKTLKKQAEGYLKQAEKEVNKNDMDLSDR